jgi:acyl-CoA synthetase (AMP-forming)/AMP-acid ligase II
MSCGSDQLLSYVSSAGDRVATLAWNTVRHFEIWYAIMGLGAVAHTVNPRLFIKDLEYIINHAESCVLLFDVSFLQLVSEVRCLTGATFGSHRC